MTSAYRVPRDVDVETTTNLIDKWNTKLISGLSSLKDEAQKAFTKENADVSANYNYYFTIDCDSSSFLLLLSNFKLQKAWAGIQQGVKDGQDKLTELGKGLQQKYDELTSKKE